MKNQLKMNNFPIILTLNKKNNRLNWSLINKKKNKRKWTIREIFMVICCKISHNQWILFHLLVLQFQIRFLLVLLLRNNRFILNKGNLKQMKKRKLKRNIFLHHHQENWLNYQSRRLLASKQMKTHNLRKFNKWQTNCQI